MSGVVELRVGQVEKVVSAALQCYEQLVPEAQRAIDEAVGRLYDHLRCKGISLLPDDHVLPISDAVAAWILSSGNKELVRSMGRYALCSANVQPEDARSTATMAMEWWRARYAVDPVIFYAGWRSYPEEQET